MKKVIYVIVILQFLSCKTEKNNSNVQNNSEKIIQEDKQEQEEIEEKFVTAISGLNYRKKPKGEIVGKFKQGEKLNIIEHTNIFETIKDENKLIKGEWLGVKVNTTIVYVFGGYLANEKNNVILLPSSYRDWENKNPVNNLNNNWTELYKKKNKYYIDKANYKIKKGYDQCTGDSTKIINTNRKTLLFINENTLPIKEVNYIKIIKNKIWPEEKIVFNYNGIKYTIRAEGEIVSPEKVHTDKGLEFFANVKNYKLYISTDNNSESLFLEEKAFNDTFAKLLFVGDIDADEKLDFIFEANRDYEEERVILYLSSKATNNEIIKKAGEIAIPFDC